MSHVFASMAILACPVGMGLMMWMMMRSGKDRNAPAPNAAALDSDVGDRYAQQARLDQLEAENADLRRGGQVAVSRAPQEPTER